MKLNKKIEFARDFAAMLHANKGQMYDDKPYSVHLAEVTSMLVNYFDVTDKDILAAGWLHDAVEDTGVGLCTIRDLFGERVADLVDAVSDEPGVNRHERKAKTYPKIKATSGALMIKLCDRYANVLHGVDTKNERMHKMYQMEHPGFQEALRTLGVYDAMWDRLGGVVMQEIKL